MVCVGEVEISPDVLSGGGQPLFRLVHEQTGATSFRWQVRAETADALPRAAWRVLSRRESEDPSGAGVHVPTTVVLASAVPGAPGRWFQVVLTAHESDRGREWVLSSTGVEHRVRPTRRDRARGVELRWSRPPGAVANGSDPELAVTLVNVGDRPWRADPDDSALTLAWVTDLDGSPPWPGGWFSPDASTPLPDLEAGEAWTLTTHLPRHALRGLPPGPVGPRASLPSLGLRTPPVRVDVVGETVPHPPRYRDHL
ncbi:hypothetical protein GCM10027047_19270 [Rhodococcus aerolatus]